MSLSYYDESQALILQLLIGTDILLGLLSIYSMEAFFFNLAE